MASPPSQPEQELGPAIDIIDIVLLGLGRFRWWILPFTILGLVIGAAIALVEVNVYTSTAKLWINLESKGDLRVETNVDGPTRQSASGKGGLTMKDELEFIRTPKLYEYIVREIGPERLNEPYDPTRFDHPGTPALTRWQHRLQDWWHNRGRKQGGGGGRSLDLNSERGFAKAISMVGPIEMRARPAGNILNIIYRARSPELAQDVVRAACVAVIARHKEVFEGQFDHEWVEEQIRVNSLKEKDASGELRKHQDDCGFLDLAAQEKRLLEKRANLENSIELNELSLTQLTNTKEQLEIDLEQIPKTELVDVPAEYVVNAYWQTVNGELTRLKVELQSYKHELRGETLAAAEAKKQKEIDGYEAELATLDKMVLQTDAHQKEQPSRAYEEAKRELRDTDLAKSNALIAERKHKKRLDNVEQQLAAIANCKPVHRAMKDQISDATRNLNRFSGTKRDYDLEKALETSSVSNIITLEEASYVPQKSGPQRGATVLFGVGGGLVAGLLFAVLRQLLDSKMRYPKSVAKCLGVPVLGVISEEKSWRRLGKRLQKEMASG